MGKDVHTIMTIIVLWDVTSCIQNYTTVNTVVDAGIALWSTKLVRETWWWMVIFHVPAALPPGRNPGTSLNWSRVGCRVGLDSLEKEFSYPFQESIHGSSVVQAHRLVIPAVQSSYIFDCFGLHFGVGLLGFWTAPTLCVTKTTCSFWKWNCFPSSGEERVCRHVHSCVRQKLCVRYK
jgi:hypothetical protein